MAILRLTQPFDAYHGTVSGQTANNRLVLYSSRRAACVARAWVLPDNPMSTLQEAVRDYLALAAAAYKGLTEAQAEAWTAAANAIMRQNILGLDYYLTGIGLFCMINTYGQIHAQAIVEDVPTILLPPVPIGLTSVVATTTVLLTIVADVTGLETGGLALCRVSLPLPGEARQARPNDCRMIDVTIDNNIEVHAAGTVTFALTIPTSLIVATDRIGVQITPLSADYFPGKPLLVGNVVVAAP